METLILIIIALIFLFTTIFLAFQVWRTFKLPYKPKKFLMTPAESNLYKQLKPYVEKASLEIFTHVRLADLIVVDYSRAVNEWKWFYKSAYKHIDFVICTKQSEILALIELDDASHLRPDRIKRDIFVNKAIIGARLNLIRIKPRQIYTQEFLMDLMQNIIKPRTKD